MGFEPGISVYHQKQKITQYTFCKISLFFIFLFDHQDEQRRCKELVARVEREKQLQLENSSIRLQAAELEAANLRDEVARQRVRIEKLETERKQLTDQIMDLRNEIIGSKEQENTFKEQERRLSHEREAQSQLIGTTILFCFIYLFIYIKMSFCFY